MQVVNIHEAKTHLSRLVERASQGESFVIAKAGRQMVKVTALQNDAVAPRRLGFMVGQMSVPNDFDRMGADDLAHLFGT